MDHLDAPDIAGIFLEKGWLYKSGGMVFGPAPAQTIIDKIYSGELSGESEVAEGEGLWTPLRSVGVFYPHVVQADAKFRSAKIEAERKKAEQKKKVLKGVKLGSIAATSVAVLVSSGLLLNKYRPWERFTKGPSPESVELRGATMDEWVERHPPLVSLGLKKQMKAEEEKEKKEALAKAAAEPPTPAKKAKKDKSKKASEKEKTPAKEEAAAAAKDEGQKVAKAATAASNGAELEQISDAEIYQVIQSNISRLFVCLREELKRTPDLRGQLEIEFAIKNDGHVGDVWIDDFRFKEGPLKDCFKQKLASWRFPRYSGERRIVKYPFFIGKR